MTEEGDKESDPASVRFCLCAMIDLRGFASHLETGDYDLRTTIGQEAILRLTGLEEALDIFKCERGRLPSYYAADINHRRINDAIFLSLDLENTLIPEIGSTKFGGLTANRLNELIPQEEKEGDWKDARHKLLTEATTPVQHFVGLVSRLHLTINKREAESNFPGAKTVVSTGFRRSIESDSGIKDDFFSANFALANVFKAEKNLHGTGVFIDDNVLQMLSYDRYSRRLVQFAHFIFREDAFDCFQDFEDIFWRNSKAEIPNPIELSLFRKNYVFRQVNPSPLSYLQQISALYDFLDGNNEPDLSNHYYKHIFHAIQIGPSKKEVDKLKPRRSFIYNGSNDLEVDVGVFREFLENGQSDTQERNAREKQRTERMARLQEAGLGDVPDDHPIHAELDELDSTKVSIEIVTVDIELMGETVYQLDEELLSGLQWMFTGDWDTIDYK